MKVRLVGAFLALPAAATVASHGRLNISVPAVSAEKPSSDEKSRSVQCKEKPRSVSLETDISIDLIYCSATPNITTTVTYQTPNSDGKFYTIITHSIHRDRDASSSYVLIYKPNADWAVPAKSLDAFGAIILKEAADTDRRGSVAQQDLRFDQRDWLPARQIILQKGTAYRIILDTRHNLLYVLYQRDDEGGADKGDSFFDSFAVDPGNVAVHPENAPGAYLPPPYPNP